ncbi:MAG: hypothetical protein V3U43_03235 [Pseudomonadales bacterium]
MARKRRLRSRDYMSGAELYDDVVTYCELGEHRTGSEDDLETADWLYRSLRRVQVDAKRHPFELAQFFLERHRLQLGDDSLESFPLWPPCATGSPVSGRLSYLSDPQALPELDGAVAVVDVPPGDSLTPTSAHTLQRVEKAGAAAILAVTPHPSGELVALNSMRSAQPWPLPILLIGTRTRDALIAAEHNAAEVTIEIFGEHERDAIAYEVVGRIARGPRLIVVSTSYSGWFRCAGERGPGVALWLALARWANNRNTDTSFMFVASSGHELGASGIDHFMDDQAPTYEAVASWLHLGAGIATYAYEATDDGYLKTDESSKHCRLLTNDATMVPLLVETFSDQELEPVLTDAPGTEMRMMIDRGHEVWGLAGGSAFHHSKQDLPEAITGPELLEPIARRLVRTIEAIELR